MMHREIAGACQHVDHDDGDGLNNRRSNLKPGSCSQNLMNQSKWRGRKTLSRFKGVSSGNRHHKWRAYIKLDGRQIWLGYFDIEEEAAEAYNSAAIQLFGDRARLNEVRGDLRPFAIGGVA